MALDTDYLSATYNSFFSVVEMDAFIQQVKWGHGGDAAWLALTPAEQEDIMLGSVNYINGLLWLGTQNVNVIVTTMQWPRDPYNPTPPPNAPQDIGLAQACWILNTLNGAGSSGGTIAVGAIKKKTVGDVTVEFATEVSGAGAVSDKTCAEQYAGQYLIPVIKSNGVGGVGLNKLP